MAARDVEWPPNYVRTFQWRVERLAQMRADPAVLRGALDYYSTRPAEFIDHWCDTYDPRVAGSGRPARMPMRLFPRQWDLVRFIHACLAGQADGLIEKCRDMGATWTCCGFSIWAWRFLPGSAVGWGSRKEQLVDKLGDPDSIFEKMRMILWGLPVEFYPPGFVWKEHSAYMKLINPDTAATITGEAGDNIGRGGRKLLYFKDESAHYVRPDLIEAALSDNTRCQIDISSVNGPATVFQRRREAGIEWVDGQPLQKTCANVFIMDWRDHPEKTVAWYEQRRAKAENDGLLHIFAQEIDRNPSAAVSGTVIPLEWVRAAIDADKKLGFGDAGMWGAALDVADNDGIGDRNAGGLRKGPVLKAADEWGERDTAHTARRIAAMCEGRGPISIQYDPIGVGSGVKAEANRLSDEGLMPAGIKFVPWNAGDAVQDPDEHVIPGDKDTPLNKDFFANLKAQGWWDLRRRFERTWRAVTEGRRYDPNNRAALGCDPDELISLPSSLPKLRQIEKELTQPTASKGARMKLVIDKTPDGARSPNIGDMIMMLYFPMTEYEAPVAAFGRWSHTGG